MVKDDEAYCQPCLSPVWDTALAATRCSRWAASEAASALAGLEWLKPLQVLDTVGDWAAQRPDVRPGGWAFQYANPALSRSRRHRRRGHGHGPRRGASSGGDGYRTAIARAANGSWACRARMAAGPRSMPTTTYYYLNKIPFADHGALLDPPTADVTPAAVDAGPARRDAGTARASLPAVAYLLRTQEKDGSWYGRWGMNYVYGTWSVLARSTPRASIRIARDAQGRRMAALPFRMTTAAGARTATATGSTIRATSRRPARPRRPPGRCSG